MEIFIWGHDEEMTQSERGPKPLNLWIGHRPIASRLQSCRGQEAINLSDYVLEREDIKGFYKLRDS